MPPVLVAGQIELCSSLITVAMSMTAFVLVFMGTQYSAQAGGRKIPLAATMIIPPAVSALQADGFLCNCSCFCLLLPAGCAPNSGCFFFVTGAVSLSLWSKMQFIRDASLEPCSSRHLTGGRGGERQQAEESTLPALNIKVPSS